MGRDRIIMLQECAEELGFSTITEALDAGYHEVQDLVNNTFKLEKVEDLTNQAYREAHEAWEKERDEVVAGLRDCYKHLHGFPPKVYSKLLDAIRFIKEQCHD